MTIEKDVTIKNKQGLHARPAALFVQIANKYNSDITIQKGRQKVNGKSIMGIMMLEAGAGSRIVITASGDDAADAMGELHNLLESDGIEENAI